MTIQPLIAGNWKMNTLPSQVSGWAADLRKQVSETAAAVAICAPYTHLHALKEGLAGSAFGVGAQDVSAHDEGAYTGEVSAAMLADVKLDYVIVGHSERRAYHNETDNLVNAKLKMLFAHELCPILCVGESLAQREAGEAEMVVVNQLKAALKDIVLQSAAELVVAYEPIWAIGTGKTATAEDAQAMCCSVRQSLAELYGETGKGVQVLYGGSMKPSNAAELLAQDDINGGLIGGASLEVDSFAAIIEAA